MQSLITIFHEVRDPRDLNARHALPALLFLALAATLCGAKSCVEIADFAEANADELAEIVDLPHGVPSHDCFSRTFRLLDPVELATAFSRFAAALREGLGLRAAKGVVAIDGKRLRRGYERDERGHDRTERRRASVVAPLAGTIAFPGLVAFGRVENHRVDAAGKVCEETHYIALSRRLTPRRLLTTVRASWSVENHLHRQLDVVLHDDDARTRKDHAPQNLSLIRRMALDMLKSHPDKRSPARKMKLAPWKRDVFYELFAYMR